MDCNRVRKESSWQCHKISDRLFFTLYVYDTRHNIIHLHLSHNVRIIPIYIKYVLPYRAFPENGSPSYCVLTKMCIRQGLGFLKRELGTEGGGGY